MDEFNSVFPSFGSPINKSRRSILAPGDLATPGKGQGKKYGGPLMFGGRSYKVPAPSDQDSTSDLKNQSNAKRSRLFQASPYHGVATNRIKSRHAVVAAAASSSNNETTATKVSDGMSSTARLILNTLDKISSPLEDAGKMVVSDCSRAEKRRAISEKFFTPTKRRRPDLRTGQEQSALKGPPLRTSIFSSPLPSSRVVPLSVTAAETKKTKPVTTSSQNQLPSVVPITFPKNTQSSFGGGKIKSSSDRKKDFSMKPSTQFVPNFVQSIKEPEIKIAYRFSSPSKDLWVGTLDLDLLNNLSTSKVFTFSKPVKVPAYNRSVRENLPDFLKHEFQGGDPAPVIKKTVFKGKYKLPDVTSIGGEAGFGGIKTASELKQGSVMSILGGFSSSRMK